MSPFTANPYIMRTCNTYLRVGGGVNNDMSESSAWHLIPDTASLSSSLAQITDIIYNVLLCSKTRSSPLILDILIRYSLSDARRSQKIRYWEMDNVMYVFSGSRHYTMMYNKSPIKDDLLLRSLSIQISLRYITSCFIA